MRLALAITLSILTTTSAAATRPELIVTQQWTANG